VQRVVRREGSLANATFRRETVAGAAGAEALAQAVIAGGADGGELLTDDDGNLKFMLGASSLGGEDVLA